MRNDTRNEAERASDDFWGWFGPKMDEWDAQNARDIASMPERDEDSRTILGAEALEIEFEPVSQAPAFDRAQAHAIRSRLSVG